MTELDSLGLSPNSKRAFMAFDQAVLGCPRCGFATSDQSLFECPSCGMVWRERTKPIEQSKAPEAGTEAVLACEPCEGKGPLVFAGGNTLMHAECLALQDKPRTRYERIATEAIPVEDLVDLNHEISMVENLPKLSKNQRRRRNQKARAAMTDDLSRKPDYVGTITLTAE